ncbi:hypothetical protein LSAT2_010597, partial [Lamellibrachia satsuma]
QRRTPMNKLLKDSYVYPPMLRDCQQLPFERCVPDYKNRRVRRDSKRLKHELIMYQYHKPHCESDASFLSMTRDLCRTVAKTVSHEQARALRRDVWSSYVEQNRT